MAPLSLSNRWTNLSNSLRIRMALLVDRPRLARRLQLVLREHGAPVSYEVFDQNFALCEPFEPGVRGDPDIALVLGDAEHDLFFVAMRERGALSSISIHEAVHDAVRDFLGRAMGASGHAYVSRVIHGEAVS